MTQTLVHRLSAIAWSLPWLALSACGSDAGSGDDAGGMNVGGSSAGIAGSNATAGNGGAGLGGMSGVAGAGSGGSAASGNAAGSAGTPSNGGAGATGTGAAGTGAAGGVGGLGGSTGEGGIAGVGGSVGTSGAAGSGSAGSGGMGTFSCAVGEIPEEIRDEWEVDPFYQKYADANGIPILSSNAPSDNALTLACQLVLEMVSMRDDVRLALIDNHTFFAMLGVDELTNDIPEYSYMPDSINERARGLGGNPGLCAEESILCGPTDRWRGESICVHEFAHTISIYGLYDADPTFEDRLDEAYQNARAAGRFENTYALENAQEYWGEGVQDWYYTNLESEPPNGVHGPIDTREELLEYDPALYDLVSEWLSPDVSWDDCYRDG